MLKLVENIEFIKNRKLEVNKIDEKEFILENKNENYILNLFIELFLLLLMKKII